MQRNTDKTTRQETQDEALHRRTMPGHRKAKPKKKQECDEQPQQVDDPPLVWMSG
jgi:hypothetical protein